MTDPQRPDLGPEDPGHLLPPETWARVQADADRLAARYRQEPPTDDLTGGPDDQEGTSGRTRAGPRAANVTQFIQAVAHGGLMGHGPTLLVVHDVESPLKAGYAASLAGPNWFGGPSAGTSAHYIIDPAVTIQMVHTNYIAWHVGPAANGFTLGYEQSGYAHFGRADWTTADGLRQMDRLAAILAEDAKFYGIPVRWATDAQIRAAADGRTVGGLCRHMDITRVLHGTTHTDPGAAYPQDLLLARVLRIVSPGPAPAPAPAPFPSDAVAGRLPILTYGMKDPIKYGGGYYVTRVQRLLGVPVTGTYDAATVAKVKSESARLLGRTVDGRTVDGVFWRRIYGMV